jgi:peroxiredoxin
MPATIIDRIITLARQEYSAKGLDSVLMGGFLIASVVVNVLQTRKVVELRGAIATLKSEGQLQVGSPVPPIEGTDANKRSAKLTYVVGGPPTVLYVFSPQCGWCGLNLESIKTLAKSIDSRYRFATISLSEDNLQDYIKQKDFNFPVYTGLTMDTTKAYKFGGTPQTLVISSDGHIQKSWMGAYTGATKSEIEAYFNVHLPELAQRQ